MRIIAGDLGGRRLHAPRGQRTRPTSDRVKEAVFNILGAPRRREGAARFRVLDLFAGSGALAFEALSRGADEAVLVEQEREAARAAERNIDALGLAGRARLMRREVGEALRSLGGDFDWIFLDPPYDKQVREAAGAPPDAAAGSPPRSATSYSYGALDRALRLLGTTHLAAGLVIAEHETRSPPSERYGPLTLVDRRRWGDTGVSFYRPTETAGSDAPGAGASS